MFKECLKECLKTRAFVSCMQTKTLLFKGLFIECSRMCEQVSSYRKCIVQCSLEYSVNCIAVATEYTSLDVTL